MNREILRWRTWEMTRIMEWWSWQTLTVVTAESPGFLILSSWECNRLCLTKPAPASGLSSPLVVPAARRQPPPTWWLHVDHCAKIIKMNLLDWRKRVYFGPNPEGVHAPALRRRKAAGTAAPPGFITGTPPFFFNRHL